MFGTPICARCSRAVYAAEQTIGPGRKPYHKSCLVCLQCNRRLDSYTLLEHDEQPYCKSCHLKNFGTPNLRHANLPSSPVSSPSRKRSASPSIVSTDPTTTNGNETSFPKLKPNRSLPSPTSPTFAKSLSNPISPTYSFGSSYVNSEVHGVDDSSQDAEEIQTDIDERAESDAETNDRVVSTTNLTNTGRPGIGTIPRTVPLYRHLSSRSVDNSAPSSPPTSYSFTQPKSPTSPVFSSLTGSRYGVALTGGVPTHSTGGIRMNNTGLFPSPTGGSPRKWGSGTPSCPRCNKSVYFAEQIKAVGKTYHKTCLRCASCGTSLDSHKLRDHDGEPYCVRCHQKAYGPQGNGYALLGKAGG